MLDFGLSYVYYNSRKHIRGFTSTAYYFIKSYTMKILKFVTDSFYHIYNRGVDKRKIFMTDEDYVRFIHSLYEFNDKHFALPYNRIFAKRNNRNYHKPLVKIICFCLMPNHFHLILQQLVDGGVTQFMRKLGTGYSMYFNLKYKRSGALFQGKFKAKIVETDEYLLLLSRYVHLNPLELVLPDWKEKNSEELKSVWYFLQTYRWSSFLDYIGINNFPFVIQKDFLLGYFQDPLQYKKFVEDFLVKDTLKIEELLLE